MFLFWKDCLAQKIAQSPTKDIKNLISCDGDEMNQLTTEGKKSEFEKWNFLQSLNLISRSSFLSSRKLFSLSLTHTYTHSHTLTHTHAHTYKPTYTHTLSHRTLSLFLSHSHIHTLSLLLQSWKWNCKNLLEMSFIWIFSWFDFMNIQISHFRFNEFNPLTWHDFFPREQH